MSLLERIRRGVGQAFGRGLDVFRGDVPQVQPAQAPAIMVAALTLGAAVVVAAFIWRAA